MFGFSIIKKEKLRRLALDYQTKCLEVKRLKEELKDRCEMLESRKRLRDVSDRFVKEES